MIAAIENNEVARDVLNRRAEARREEEHQAMLKRLRVEAEQAKYAQMVLQDVPRRFTEEWKPLIAEAALKGRLFTDIFRIPEDHPDLPALRKFLPHFFGRRGYSTSFSWWSGRGSDPNTVVCSINWERPKRTWIKYQFLRLFSPY